MARICEGGGRVVGPVPAGDGPAGPHRVPHRGAQPPRRPGDPARDHVRPHRHRQPAGERLPGHRPLRAARRGYYGGVVGAHRPGRRRHAAPWTPRSSSAPPTSTPPAGGGRGGRHPGPALRPAVRGRRDPRQGRRPARGAGRDREPARRDPLVQAALVAATRRSPRSGSRRGARAQPQPVLAGRRALVVDAEDTFTAMLAHQLRAARARGDAHAASTQPYRPRRPRPRRAGPRSRRSAGGR